MPGWGRMIPEQGQVSCRGVGGGDHQHPFTLFPPSPSPLPGGAPLNSRFSPPPPEGPSCGLLGSQVNKPDPQVADMASPLSGDPSPAGLPPPPVATPGESHGGGRDGGEGGVLGI